MRNWKQRAAALVLALCLLTGAMIEIHTKGAWRVALAQGSEAATPGEGEAAGGGEPTVEPTQEPAPEPTVEPTQEPTPEPTEAPLLTGENGEPTIVPTVEPTIAPTTEPTIAPTVEPTQEATAAPTPEITGTPEITATPGATTTPEATAMPEATTTLEVTGTPEATTTPEVCTCGAAADENGNTVHAADCPLYEDILSDALRSWAEGFIAEVNALPGAEAIAAMPVLDGEGKPNAEYEQAKTADMNARTMLLRRPQTSEMELAALRAETNLSAAEETLKALFGIFEGKELPYINEGVDGLPTAEEARARLDEMIAAAQTIAESAQGEGAQTGADAENLSAEAVEYLNGLWTRIEDVDGRIQFLTGDITDESAYADYIANNIGDGRMEKFYALYDLLDTLMGGSLLPAPYAQKDSLDADEAYISNLEVQTIEDGTEPFDGDDAAGNDSGADNKIVRSFDSVKYTVKATTASYASGDSYKAARAKLEIVLPYAKDQAEFDTAAMGWMMTGGAYQWEITESDGKQILTCWRDLPANTVTGIALPGSFSVEIYVKVKGMADGATVQPTFSAAMEHNTWDGDCAAHNRQEKASVTPEAVTVSAAPKYNIKIGEGSLYSYKDTLDFSTGNGLAANKGDYTVNGRVIPYGAVIQLYNDNASKGLKGIELPQGDITFTLNVSSAYNINGGSTVNTTNAGYKPLLWSYEGNADGDTQADGRVLNGSEKYANGAGVPLNKQGDAQYSCYDGGSYTAVQSGNQITVTVKDYKIDTDKFPDYVWWSNLTGTPHFGEYVGCISAGEFWIVQPYVNTVSGADAAAEFNGAGTFTTTVEATDLKMTSVSGQKQEDSAGTNSAQMVKNDDSAAATTYLSLPGGMDNRAYYTYYGNTDFLGHGVNSWASFEDGSDYAVVGELIGIVGGFVYTANGEKDNRLMYATSLLKFDADAIALTGGVYRHGDVAGAGLTPTVLYAAKPDGGNWTSDAEMQSATEDDLVFHTSIPQGNTCVAVLLIYTGPASKIDGYIEARTMLQAKVKDGSVRRETYMLTETSRVWTTANLREANMALAEIPNWTDTGTKLADFPVNRYELKYNYTKETYDESGLKGTHSGNYQQGDSLLVIGLKTGITKKIAQKVDGEEKQTYNLDANQRVADYILQPSTISAAFGAGTQQTTVTVVDTLPKHLTYRPNSAYFGGTYTQTSANGGTQGSIEGGTQREPTIVNNADGTQTLTWNIPVTVGEIMPAIYYSCDIGRTDGGEDVPNAAQLVNTARIYAPEDMRQPSAANGNLAEVGIGVTRLSATSFAKTAKETLIEADGTASYTIFYGNNTSEAIEELVFLDTMPYNGDTRGSEFTGSYTISGWKMDMSELSGSTLALYYTYSDAYKDATVDGSGLAVSDFPGADWTQATIAADGTATLPNDASGKPPVAWALVGRLAGHNTILVDLDMKLAPKNATGRDSYVNAISIHGNSVTAKVETKPIPATITLSKTVSGNMGDRNKAFSFTISIKDENGALLPPGTKLAYEGNGIAGGDLTIGENGSATLELKHGQSVTIRDIYADWTATVTEDSEAAEGYLTSIYMDGAQTPVDGLTTGEQKACVETASVMVYERSFRFENRREAGVPTGILLDIWPYALMVLLALGGGMALIPGRRRRGGESRS